MGITSVWPTQADQIRVSVSQICRDPLPADVHNPPAVCLCELTPSISLFPCHKYAYVFTSNAYLCARVFAFPYSFRSTLWFLPLQAPSSSVLCDRTPAVQQSFNERSTWERRNEEQEDKKDLMGLFFPPFSSATCAILRDVKRCPSADVRFWLWLALQSHRRHKETK